MLKKILLILLCSFSHFANADYSKIVVFGDSLSDMGNACPKDYLQKPIFCALYPSGCFSNGKVWVEHLAEEWDLDLKTSRLGGYNFAFAGATSGWGTEETPGLRGQVHSYLEKTRDQADASALYIIWIGANDFKNKFMNTSLLFDVSELRFEEVIEDIYDAVIRLSRKGARNFLIPNLVPIHSTPLVSKTLLSLAGIFTGLSWFSFEKGVIDFVFEVLIDSYNWRLSKRMIALEKERMIKIHHPDLFHFFKKLEVHYKDYGLESTEDFFYLDQFHPSALGHKILAKELAKGL